MTDRGGKTNHAELELESGVIMLGTPGDDHRTPNELGGRTHTTYIYVDDVDAHFERAKSEGAEIRHDVADPFYGDRTYAVHDPEGHWWTFATHVRDVSLEEMQAATA